MLAGLVLGARGMAVMMRPGRAHRGATLAARGVGLLVLGTTVFAGGVVALLVVVLPLVVWWASRSGVAHEVRAMLRRPVVHGDVSAHHKELVRSLKSRRLWGQQMEAVGLVQCPGDLESAPEVAAISVLPGGHGLRVAALLPPGMTPEHVAAKSEEIRHALGVPRVRVSAHETPGGAVLQLQTTDPLAEVVMYHDVATSPTIERVPFAVDEQGDLVDLRILESNVLLGGEPGGGKSAGQTAILAGLAQLEHLALIGLDLKRVELRPWASRFTTIATSNEDATRLLRAGVQEMERRYDVLEATGRKKVTAADLCASMPLLVYVADEMAELLAGGEDKKADQERGVLLRRLVALGRACGIVVCAATQKPDSTVVPTGLRDLIQQRVAYRCGNRAMTEVILGSGVEGGPAHELDGALKGSAYTLVEGDVAPRRVRTLWLPDEHIAPLVEATAHLRPSWQLPTAEGEEVGRG